MQFWLIDVSHYAVRCRIKDRDFGWLINDLECHTFRDFDDWRIELLVS